MKKKGEESVNNKGKRLFYILLLRVWLPSKFCSEKIPRNRLGTIFVIPQNKVFIPCDSKCFRRVHYVTRNKKDRNSAK